MRNALRKLMGSRTPRVAGRNRDGSKRSKSSGS